MEPKPIPNFPRHVATSTGEIYRKHDNCRALTHATRGKLFTILISPTGEVLRLPVDKLVASAFIRPLSPEDVVIHKDGDLTNNRPLNLEVGTPPPSSEKKSQLTEQQVRQIKILSATSSQLALAEAFDCSQSTIHNILAGKTWRKVHP